MQIPAGLRARGVSSTHGGNPVSLRFCRPLSGLEPRSAASAWGAEGGRCNSCKPDHSGIFQPVGILALIQAIQVRILVPEPRARAAQCRAPASGAGGGGCDSHVLDHGGGRQGVSGALYAPGRLVRSQHPRPGASSSTAEHPPDMRKTSVRLAQGRPTGRSVVANAHALGA